MREKFWETGYNLLSNNVNKDFSDSAVQLIILHYKYDQNLTKYSFLFVTVRIFYQ